jgi:hypothetical protein
MADLPPPETLRQPTGDVVHVNSTQGLNTMSIGGKTYQILDVGYVCGSTCAVTVLSEFTCLFSTAPYCAVCASCFHPEGGPPVPVPDYTTCGIPAGLYGILVVFKPAWICHCLKMLGYNSSNVNLIQPVGTAPFCGAPSLPPMLHGFNPFPALAAGALIGGALAISALGGSSGSSGSSGSGGSGGSQAATSATLPDGTVVDFSQDGTGTAVRPGIDSDINALPIHPAGTLEKVGECPDDPPGGVILTR